MPWRVTRIVSLKDRRVSVHAREEDARADVAAQLKMVLDFLANDMHLYAGVLRYPERFPGFMEDAAEALDKVGALLESGDTWGAYWAWRAFMAEWEKLPIPLWGQIGDVIVEGPGGPPPPSFIPRKMFRPPRTRRVLPPEEKKGVLEIMRDLIGTVIQSAVATIALEASLAGKEISHDQIEAAAQPILDQAISEVQTVEQAIEYIGQIMPLQQRLETELRRHFGLPEGGIEEWMRKHGPTESL
jgi:hypothetical protein